MFTASDMCSGAVPGSAGVEAETLKGDAALEGDKGSNKARGPKLIEAELEDAELRSDEGSVAETGEADGGDADWLEADVNASDLGRASKTSSSKSLELNVGDLREGCWDCLLLLGVTLLWLLMGEPL
jgi:hypothetical protein